MRPNHQLVFVCIKCIFQVMGIGCLFYVVFPCQAQQKPVAWLQDFANPGLKGMSPSKGLSLEWNNMPDFKMISTTDGNTSIYGNATTAHIENFRRVKMKVRAPLWNSDGLKVILGLRYDHDQIKLERDGINTDVGVYERLKKNIRTTGADITFLKPFRGKSYLVLRGGMQFSGEFSNLGEIDHRYLSYNISGLIGTKKSENTEFGIGLYASNTLGIFSIYPVALYNHNFNDKFGVEALLPKRLAFRYNHNDKTIFSAVAEGEGGNYFMPDVTMSPNEHQDMRIKYTDVKAGISIQRQLFSILWGSIDFGYRHNLNFDFERATSTRNDFIARSWIPGSMYANVTLFVTPPKKFSKNK